MLAYHLDLLAMRLLLVHSCINTIAVPICLHIRVETGSGYPGHVLPRLTGSDMLYKISESGSDCALDRVC